LGPKPPGQRLSLSNTLVRFGVSPEECIRWREELYEPGACVSVGDRYDMDIAIPLSLGMGGILVAGVADVYQL
jgi:ribonucleotide monophosphatase NagD (HAD superfamily)